LQADTSPAGYAVACSIHSSSAVRECTELPSARNCTEEMNFASIPSRDRTGMTFVNRSDKPIKLYWLDFRAMRTLYRFLPPGDKVSQATFIGTTGWCRRSPTSASASSTPLPNRSRSSDSKVSGHARDHPGIFANVWLPSGMGVQRCALEQ